MGIVYRNGRPYLYESVWEGGRVTSRYVGRGEDALLINALKTVDRDEQDYQRYEQQVERKRLIDLERGLDELARRARDLAREALTAAGYHQHHRSEWRKRRAR
jgi:hypothetical protein